MSNSLLSLPAAAGERFRSLDATPVFGPDPGVRAPTPVFGASPGFGRIHDR